MVNRKTREQVLEETRYLEEAQLILLENEEYFGSEETTKRLKKISDKIQSIVLEYLRQHNESSK